MVPNVFVPFFGKLLFCAADLLCGVMIYRLLKLRRVPESRTLLFTASWLLNPMVFVISARGNAESLVSVLVLGTLLALFSNRLWLSAILFGAAVHLKTYPIIYALPIFFFLDGDYPRSVDPTVARREAKTWAAWARDLFLPVRLKFAFTSAFVFLFLTWVCYALYGNAFVDESLLYHVVRRDHRHNFSPYWYYIYLSFEEPGSILVSLAAFLPQALLLVLIGYAYRRDLFFSLFLETFIFVTFNKVCTSQYFVWFIAFLPLVLPFSNLLYSSRGMLVFILSLWVASQAVWLNFAYKLEIAGEAAFAQTWAASVFFFVSNVVVAGQFIAKHNGTSLPAAAAAAAAPGPSKARKAT